ncbi:beta-galactosidase [Cohnella sp. REN36]|uniref:beta-galactosidase n=1 Tax=Cohnella sp. REN36 TaxID=2887347 RepID=UPI001D142432|nr:beta-galactosidase [Cohnella sp. REN36]MCC3376408.1 beta-galactosidase [Cohnella sp. REN36]
MLRKHPPISGSIPDFMHGADYNPDQWLHDPAVLEEDIRLMKLAGCNVMAVGIFAWAAMEPEEGQFEFDWLDRVLDRFAEEGLFAWLATPSGARPAWMSERYPEVLRIGANRVRNLHGHRHNHCYTSPVYREKTAILNAKLASRYARHPAVVGWHISNEYGGDCHCELCQEAFREWLQARYGTLDALNAAWWTSFWAHTYTSWSQIESPTPHGETMVHAHNLDWRRFVTDRTVDFCAHEIAVVRPFNPDLPVTTNMMDWYEGLDYRRFAGLLDVIAWDAYPTWHDAADDSRTAAWFAFNHDLFRSLKDKPFMLMESTPSLTNWQPVSKLKRPGMHRLSSLQAVAHGADTVQYFQWRKSRGSSEKLHGAVVDHVGHEHTRVFRDVAELGGALAALRDVVGTSTPARAAILTDWDNRWAVCDAQGPRNCGVHYEDAVLDHYRALWALGVPIDVIGSEEERDLGRYDLIVAPMLYLCRSETGARLERYVEAGGVLVSTYWSGIVDERDLCHLGGFPGPLRRTLGIWAEEMDALYDGETNSLVPLDGPNGAAEERKEPEGGRILLGRAYVSSELCELVHLEGAEALAAYGSDFYAGRPALTVNRLGAGKAYYLATRAEPAFYADFYGWLASALRLPRALDTALPDGVTAQVRTDGETDFVFVLNFSGRERIVPLDGRVYIDAETGEPLSGPALTLSANGSRVLRRASANG